MERKELVKHLEELRNRSIIVLISVIAFLIVTLPFSSKLMQMMIKDLLAGYGEVIATSPLETFFTRIKISGFLSLAVALPTFGLYEFLKFITPALKEGEKRLVYLSILPSLILFFIGAVFSYFLILPRTIQIFLKLSKASGVRPMYTISKLFNFSLITILLSGAVFETPLIVLTLVKLEVIDYKTLVSYRKWIYAAMTIITAAITPDITPISMILLLVPMAVLFEISLLIAKRVE